MSSNLLHQFFDSHQEDPLRKYSHLWSNDALPLHVPIPDSRTDNIWCCRIFQMLTMTWIRMGGGWSLRTKHHLALHREFECCTTRCSDWEVQPSVMKCLQKRPRMSRGGLHKRGHRLHYHHHHHHHRTTAVLCEYAKETGGNYGISIQYFPICYC